MIFVAGTRKSAFTTGVAYCRDRDAYLPFVAFADTVMIEAELGLTNHHAIKSGAEDVQPVIEAFGKHGSVIFFDNPVAVERFMEMIDNAFDIAAMTKWYDHEPDPVRTN